MLTKEAEERSAAFLLKDPSAGQFLPYVEPEDCKAQVWKETIRSIKECWRHFNRMPTPREFWGYIVDHSLYYRDAAFTERDAWKKNLEDAYRIELTTASRRQLGEWVFDCKIAEISNMQSSEEPREERLQRAQSILRKVTPLLSGQDGNALLILSEDSMKAEMEYHEGKTADPFPTGFSYIDTHLPHNGLERGDFALFMGPRGRGKSAALTQQMMTALAIGRRCLVINLESTEVVYRRRMFANMTGIGMGTEHTRSEFAEAVADWWRQHPLADPTKAIFKSMPSRRTTVDDIVMVIEAQESIHGPIDMLLLDYLNLVKPAVKYKDRWEALGDLSQEVTSVMIERNMVGWSAIQANRAGEKAEVLDGTHTGGAIDMLNAPSLVLMIEQDAHEKDVDNEEQTCRLGVYKNRNGRSQFRVPSIFCPTQARFWQDPAGRPISMEGKKQRQKREEEAVKTGGNVIQIGERRKMVEAGGPGFHRRSTGERFKRHQDED